MRYGCQALGAVVSLSVVFAPAIARADDDDDGDDAPMIIVEAPQPDPVAPPVATAPAPEPIRRTPPRYVDASYSSQTLLLDGVAVAMFVPGVVGKIDPLPGLGLLTYWLGPPIVHLTHGNVGKGFADLGIRTVAPFLFALPSLMTAAALTGNASAETRRDALDVGGYTGLALGCAFAMVVDAWVLARERVPAERAYFRDDAKLRLLPSGVAGRF